MTKKFFECVEGKFEFDKLPYDIRLHLINISHIIGRKVRITSHVRTPAQNDAVGGSLTSSHLTGQAIDIACLFSDERYKIVNYCIPFFSRIGIYDKHIHLDWDSSKFQNVLWVGKSS